MFVPGSPPSTQGDNAGEQGTEREGKGGREFPDDNVRELVFLKPLQLHSPSIPALVWFLEVWKQSAKA